MMLVANIFRCRGARWFLYIVVATLLFGLTGTIRAHAADDGPGKLPQFEVATIKPLVPGEMHRVGVEVDPGGRVRVRGVTLKRLVSIAFNLSDWQMSGGETTNKDQYDVEAKAPEADSSNPYDTRHSNVEISDMRLRKMLQALVIERLQLKFHRETRTGTVYVLESSGKPLRLKRVDSAGQAASLTGGVAAVAGRGWLITDASMAQVAKHLSNSVLHATVMDKTGLEGLYNFESATILTAEDFRSPAFLQSFLAVVGEMGLELKKTQGPVESFVIDRLEVPAPN